MSRLTGKDAFGMFEAYQAVYAPQEEVTEIDEAITSEKGKAKAAEMIAKRSTPSGRAKPGQGASVAAIKHISRANVDNLGGTPPNLKIAKNPVKSRSYGGTGNKAARRAAALKNEEFDIFDIVLEFLQTEGFAETLEDAEWMMANMIDEEAIGIILGEAIYSEKGKAKAAEMIAKRSTPSGRAKSGKGANVAHIRQIRGSGRGDFDREGLGGTPMTRTMAKNPIKKQNYVGTGNKAARRAGLTPTREKPNAWKEEFEFWVDALVEEGYDLSGYTWEEMYEFYLDEAQEARNNPEKYEAGEKKKYAPVRGERTPMPPRGDKRREDFEKWYAAQRR